MPSRKGKPIFGSRLVGQPDHEQGQHMVYMQAYDNATDDYKDVLCDTGGNIAVNIVSSVGLSSDVSNIYFPSLANLDVPLSTISSGGSEPNLDIPLSSLNANVVAIDDKIRLGAEQTLDPATVTLPQFLAYGLHEAHGGGADDMHPLAVNDNGHQLVSIQEINGVTMPISNANLDIPLSTLNTTTENSNINNVNGLAAVVTKIGDLNSNVVSQSSLLVDCSNLNIPLSDLLTSSENSNITNFNALGAAATTITAAVSGVDSNVQVVNTNVSKLTTTYSSVYANSVTNTGQIVLAAAAPGRLMAINVASRSSNPCAVGVYDKSAVAPVASDTPIFTMVLDPSTPTATLNFGPGGIDFTSGLGLRAQCNASDFNINENVALGAEIVACSLVYVLD